MPVADELAHRLGVASGEVDLVAAVLVVDQDQVPRTIRVTRNGEANGRELGYARRVNPDPLTAVKRHDQPPPRVPPPSLENTHAR